MRTTVSIGVLALIAATSNCATTAVVPETTVAVVPGPAAASPAAGLAPGSGNFTFAADSGVLITMLGRDTIAVERFVSRGTTLEIEALTRSPRTMMQRSRLEWTDDGLLRSYQSTSWPPDGAPGEPTVRMTRQGDSLVWSMRGPQGARTVSRPFVNAGVIFAPPLLSPYIALARLAAARGDTSLLQISPGMNLAMSVSRPSAEWLSFAHPEFGTVRVRVDAQGRLQEVDARQSTVGSLARPAMGVDIAALARSFAAADAAGRGLGVLSPPDTARAQIGGANVSIAYYRPAARGRTIFGGVVPWARVWRTGANEATGFTTDRDLLIGETRVPAGSYTLWSLPTQDGWHLIVNKQTGQWGTQYNAAEDLAHIPMRVETLSSPVDQFTITLAPDGMLSLAWGDRRGTVPIRVAP